MVLHQNFNICKNIKSEPRFWTLEQIKTLIIRLIRTSKVRRRQDDFILEIENIKTILKDEEKRTKSLEDLI